MKAVVTFLESGHYRDNLWDGEFYVTPGQQREVSIYLAAHLVSQHLASLYHPEDDSSHAALPVNYGELLK
ncbi:hypothetical protein [Vibrio mangrovi]|uniref:Uncharacterized protein n=1 Tax=Vibrio mangrovi TaxID=474394 RepID=A0A1Y6IS46_9VIBR|nr:hypothetical protein [Vibrio mangrovi]MDW6003588.1 hypothetical protein [Vibrio mangrovi]SMR99620.1 hypothetical protein VIM7927_00847 [Vibrio mangrovi]